MTRSIALRINDELADRLDAYSSEHPSSRNAIIESAIAKYIALPNDITMISSRDITNKQINDTVPTLTELPCVISDIAAYIDKTIDDRMNKLMYGDLEGEDLETSQRDATYQINPEGIVRPIVENSMALSSVEIILRDNQAAIKSLFEEVDNLHSLGERIKPIVESYEQYKETESKELTKRNTGTKGKGFR